MKKILVKFGLLFLLVFFPIMILNLLYTRTNYWKNTATDSISKFKNVPESIQLANVGSSHGLCSFDYNDVPYQSFNFAISSQRFLYDYAILRQYVCRFSKDTVLLIPISYFQITQVKLEFQDQRARYYRFLDKEYMDFFSITEKILFSYFPILTAGETLKFIIKDQPSPNELIVMTEPELIKYSIERHKSWTTDSEDVFDLGEEGFSYNKSIVSQIIEFCYVHDIKPVLITTPITSVLNNIYNEKTPGFFDGFYRFAHELQDAYPSLPYFDYSHDPRFENDFSLFKDGDHLNIHGAKKFTAIVISDLQANDLLALDETSR